MNHEPLSVTWNARRMRNMILLCLLILLNLSNACVTPVVKTDDEQRSQMAISEQDTQALIKSIEEGDITAVQRLLSKGVSPNLKDKRGFPVLSLAILRKRKDVLEALLHAGADINAAKDNGESAIITAILSDQADTVEFLIQQGANVNVKIIKVII